MFRLTSVKCLRDFRVITLNNLYSSHAFTFATQSKMAPETPSPKLHHLAGGNATDSSISPPSPPVSSPEMTPITPPQTYEDIHSSRLPRMNLLASFSQSNEYAHCSQPGLDQLATSLRIAGGESERADSQRQLSCRTSNYEKISLIATGQWSEVHCARPKPMSSLDEDHRRRSDSGVAEAEPSSALRRHRYSSLVAIKSPNSILARTVLHSESKILSYLSNLPGATDSIVGFFGFDPATRSLVLEYAPRTLESCCQPSGLDSLALRHASQQLVSGLSFLHAANIIHGDIKPSNILLRENTTSTHFIYCDFSSSCFDSPSSEMPESAGTYEYMAPEEFRVDSKSTKASDVYSLGMTLITAASGRSIYADARNKMILRAYAASGTPLAFVSRDNGLLQKLKDSTLDLALRLVLTRMPQTRISAKQWQDMPV